MNCAECGKEFTPHKHNQIYCDLDCYKKTKHRRDNVVKKLICNDGGDRNIKVTQPGQAYPDYWTEPEYIMWGSHLPEGSEVIR
jgi:hypothetical protein